ncbi:response regulator transcription factor [Niabella hibiscisoli]|uniref:response regulator transcription factor n=1 Tax=Niabella hibiscisoli TaxID=1825928 RepID=UPI001F0E5B40|nr:response regulator [Niabella hibiscisoli]MCH5720592.1 response regulator [Niabella hibiscisoli]
MEPNSEKPSILIVDDNEDILDFLKDDLGELYTIFTAPDGVKALSVLNEQVVQLVISDVMMPEMDGIELCEKIKSNFEFSHIPVILLTAKNTLQAKIEGLNTGADAYIEKPFSPEHVAAQVLSLLNNRNKIKEYFAQSPFAHIKSIAHSKMDEEFLDKMNNFIVEHISDTALDVDHLAVAMNMSRATFYRKVKSISNLSPYEMINISRLKKAVELMNTRMFPLSEIAERVGYQTLTQLGRNFQKQFRLTPSEYLQLKK